MEIPRLEVTFKPQGILSVVDGFNIGGEVFLPSAEVVFFECFSAVHGVGAQGFRWSAFTRVQLQLVLFFVLVSEVGQ